MLAFLSYKQDVLKKLKASCSIAGQTFSRAAEFSKTSSHPKAHKLNQTFERAKENFADSFFLFIVLGAIVFTIANRLNRVEVPAVPEPKFRNVFEIDGQRYLFRSKEKTAKLYAVTPEGKVDSNGIDFPTDGKPSLKEGRPGQKGLYTFFDLTDYFVDKSGAIFMGSKSEEAFPQDELAKHVAAGAPRMGVDSKTIGDFS